MILIDTLKIRNFLSFGNAPVEIPISLLKQCFILGQVIDSDTPGVKKRSNGAGKSSLTQAILWCLSGRTMHHPNPGDQVLNWFTRQDCEVGLQFRDGSKLTRIRKTSGETELLFSRQDRTIIDCTLSTTGHQQKQLNKELRFDYEIFCGSMFFNQIKHPWLDMSDQSRKQLLERIMGIDRISAYAEVAKNKRDKVESEQAVLTATITTMNDSIAELADQLQKAVAAKAAFDTSRNEKLARKQAEIDGLSQQIFNFTLIDIQKLQERWQAVDKVKAKIAEMEAKLTDIDRQTRDVERSRDALQRDYERGVSVHASELLRQKESIRSKARKATDTLNQKIMTQVRVGESEKATSRGNLAETKSVMKATEATIKLWTAKAGKICTTCEQPVSADYVGNKIEPYHTKLQQCAADIAEREQQISAIERKIEDYAQAGQEAVKQLEQAANVELAQLEQEASTKASITRDELNVQIQQKNEEIRDFAEGRTKLDVSVQDARSKLRDYTPPMTIVEAKTKNAQREMLQKSLESARADLKRTQEEANPHGDTITDLEEKIEAKRQLVEENSVRASRFGILFPHLNYIYRAHSDRKRIKSYATAMQRPFFNSRLAHYLDIFELDLRLELTDSLGLSSNMWGYAFQSGGERARSNLAFMLAIFDLHERIYGRQCNILVLDEPDNGLDEAGVDALIRIIKDDLANRFETIMVISHRNVFQDVFPNQITVSRTDRISCISDIR